MPWQLFVCEKLHITQEMIVKWRAAAAKGYTAPALSASVEERRKAQMSTWRRRLGMSQEGASTNDKTKTAAPTPEPEPEPEPKEEAAAAPVSEALKTIAEEMRDEEEEEEEKKKEEVVKVSIYLLCTAW